MRATTPRPSAKLISIRDAEREYGLPSAAGSGEARRGCRRAATDVRRFFIVRADLEQKLDAWRIDHAA